MQANVVSQGRTLVVLRANERAVEALDEWVRSFGRALLECTRETIPALKARLESLSHSCDTDLSLLSVAAEELPAIARGREASRLPSGWQLDPLDADAEPADVLRLQELQEAAGLTPLPGYVLRGDGVRSFTLVLRDEHRLPQGGASVLDLSQPDRSEAMVFAVFLQPSVRGCGYSYSLNTAALQLGAERFAARTLIEVVETGNRASMRMNLACGLKLDPHRGYLFVTSSLASNDPPYHGRAVSRRGARR